MIKYYDCAPGGGVEMKLSYAAYPRRTSKNILETQTATSSTISINDRVERETLETSILQVKW